ncbi:MAG: tetratricopeptide repeat protein [Omnitrophica bacterium]|nr:tetratricopeptide repeat protein [Candidatus Omnitrophota bacterium]
MPNKLFRYQKASDLPTGQAGLSVNEWGQAVPGAKCGMSFLKEYWCQAYRRGAIVYFPALIFLFSIIFLSGPITSFAQYLDEDMIISLKGKIPHRRASEDVYKQKINKGLSYFEQGLYEEAKDFFWEAIDLFPEEPEAYVNLATVHIKELNYENATRILKQAEQLSPDDYYQKEIIFYNLGLCSYMTKYYPEASEYFSKALALYPDFAEALYYLGVINNERGEQEFAFLNLFKARYLFDKKSNTKYSREAEHFLDVLRKSQTIKKVALAKSLLEEAKSSLREKDLDRASELLEESIVLNPGHVDAYYELALLYSRRRAFHNSIAYLNRIIEVDDKSFKAFLSLGYAYRELKYYDKALAAFQKALEIGEGPGEVYYDIGMTYLEQGKLQLAKKNLGQAKKDATKEKDLILIGKIKNAQDIISEIRGDKLEPARAYRRIERKAAARPAYPYHKLSGNRGHLDSGYFMPLPKKKTKYKKTKIRTAEY